MHFHKKNMFYLQKLMKLQSKNDFYEENIFDILWILCNSKEMVCDDYLELCSF